MNEQTLGVLGKHSDMEVYRQQVLLPEEEVIASLDVVGFAGIVGHRTDLKLGRGLIMCTKLGEVHRIHYYINDLMNRRSRPRNRTRKLFSPRHV